MGALSSFSDEAKCEAGGFSFIRGAALVSFTFLFPVVDEIKWDKMRKSWTKQGGFRTRYVSTSFHLSRCD